MTLTTEQLKNLTYSGGIVGDLARELLANREAQPVACDIERIKRHALPAGECPRQSQVVLLSRLQRLLTAPPAPANANPVAWEMRYWNSGHNMWHDWERITAEQHAEMSVQHAADNDYEFRVLYDAPPEPAVPDDVQRDADRWRAMLGSARIRILGAAGFGATGLPGGDPDYRHFGMEIWTHYPGWLTEKNEYGIDILTKYADICRAAMLAQPVSSGYKLNSPEIPDGWIACSERMPELDKRVLLYFDSYDGHIEDGCIGDDGDGPYHYFFDGDSLQQEPTHWMPLPAAPEGGNDHDTRR
ncbi:DUF551 domain-containing protein [Serratia marcescens]|nr:DUF551 domain-containing protein [Serratia marcescens]